MGFFLISKDYVGSPHRDFECYLRILTGLNEHNIQIILEQYNSKFITYIFHPGSYTFKALSIILSKGFKNEFEIRAWMRRNHEHDLSDSFTIDCDNVSLITKLRLGPQIMILRFD